MELAINPYPFFWSLILPGLLLVFILMIRNELKTKRRNLRIAMSLIAFLSILCLALRPSLKSELPGTSIALLTQNFNSAIIDSLKTAHIGLKVIDLAESNKTIAGIREEYSINKVFVLGDGLEKYESRDLKNLDVTYIPGDKPIGIVGLDYQSKIKRGKTLDARVSLRMKDEGILVYVDPSEERDTIKIEKGESTINLHVVKSVVGNHIDNLYLYDSKGALVDKGLLPYSVRIQEPITVVFLMGYPDIETRFLKNWLGNNKHEVIVRSKVSENRYITERLNMKRSVRSITDPEFLSTVDLVISDRVGWDELSSAQREVISEQVKERGMGMIFLLNDAAELSTSKIGSLIREDAYLRGSDQKAEFVLLESGIKFTLPKLELAPGTNTFSFPITYDSKNSVTSFATFNGLGKVAFSLVSNTYSLMLNGFNETYSSYWSEIVDVAGKNWKRDLAEIETDKIGRAGHPLGLDVKISKSDPELIIDSTRIGLRQNPYFDNSWSGTFWPMKSGWHSVKVGNTLIDHLFVFPSGYWESLERERKQSDNRIEFESAIVSERETIRDYQPISPFYFFIIFVLTMGVLWLEPRL